MVINHSTQIILPILHQQTQYCGSSAATDWENLISTTVEPGPVGIIEFSSETWLFFQLDLCSNVKAEAWWGEKETESEFQSSMFQALTLS